MRVLLIFIDGVGLGDATPDNPFILTETPCLRDLLQGNSFTKQTIGFAGERVSLQGLDATLGIEGLPQSATGQASIFTGNNAPRLIGAHLNGFPNPSLRQLLASQGVFRVLKNEGYRCCFANAYRPQFFDLLRQGLPGDIYSCSTLITHYGALPFYTLNDLQEGKALYMDITNNSLKQMGFQVAEISPEEGGRRLAAISRKFDFTLFEYFLSDLAGHLGEKENAARVVKTLDRFLGSVADTIDAADTLLIVTSDHGNLEDLTNKNHTDSLVPALLIGEVTLRASLALRLQDLTHILPAIRAALAWDSPGEGSLS